MKSPYCNCRAFSWTSVCAAFIKQMTSFTTQLLLATKLYRQNISKGIHRHAGARTVNTPFPCVCWSSDTGQWLRSRSNWYSREGWRGQNRRNLPDRYHTWRQQHFSTNVAAIIERKSEQGKTDKTKCNAISNLVKWSHLAETSPCVWVARFRNDTTLVTVTRYTVREAMITCSTAVTLPAPNPRLAAT